MHGDVCLSHITAAQLWRLPLPASVEEQVDLDVMCGPTAGPVRRSGCIGHRGIDRRKVVTRHALPVTDLAHTWVDLGEVLGRGRGLTLDDLVVAGDVVARLLDEARGEGRGVMAMRTALDARTRPRGKVLLTEALTLVSPRSGSPVETRARLVFARGGLPAPELNAAVHFDGGRVGDGAAGWMLEGDFVWRRQRVVAEYQGDHHKTIGQRAVDVSRRHLAEDDGWTFVEVFAGDVYTRGKRIAMLRRLGRALGVSDMDLNLT
ncbi:hypothetical protein LL946_09605 [Knoellia locipacati]|uniref:hypothetical protein n=1 Tax=Knoellia locipacati TaxID=882824 RepID=UPI00385075F6